MRIGIFGGCFNPIHKMHEKIATHLLKNNYIDKIIFVPTGMHYAKPDLETEINRYNMLKIISNQNPKISISDYEFGKLKDTYETLEHFQKNHKEDEIYFITGTDNLKEMNTWNNYNHILKKYNILSIKRNIADIEEIKNKYENYIKNIQIININLENISSSKIRKEIKTKGYINELSNFINPKVLEYIKSNNIYKNKP